MGHEKPWQAACTGSTQLLRLCGRRFVTLRIVARGVCVWLNGGWDRDMILCLPCVACGVAWSWISRRYQHFLVLPLSMLAVPLLFFIALGMSGGNIQARGAFIELGSSTSLESWAWPAVPDPMCFDLPCPCVTLCVGVRGEWLTDRSERAEAVTPAKLSTAGHAASLTTRAENETTQMYP